MLVILTRAKHLVLAGLAHSRDSVLLLRQGITELGSLTFTGDARCLGNRAHTGNARKIGKHLLDALVLEGSFKRVLVVFHVCIIPDEGREVKCFIGKSLVARS